MDRLVDAAELLRGVRITCGDFEQVLMAPGSGVWNYVDAPYMRDTELPKSGKLYQFGFTLDDHCRLAEVVRRCPHHVCLSYDDHPFIRELYQGFNIHPVKWTYCGTSLKKKPKGRELLITNYTVAPTAMIRIPNVKGFDMLGDQMFPNAFEGDDASAANDGREIMEYSNGTMTVPQASSLPRLRSLRPTTPSPAPRR